MKKAARAPHSRRWRSGETLVEVLIALLIVTLSTLLLASMSTVSGSIDLAARQNDERFYEALSKVEAMDGAGISVQQVTITESTPGATPKRFRVTVYTSDGLAAYKATD